MKKNLLLSIFLLAPVLMFAQEAKTLFVNMPDSITPLLTAINRADCVDFLASNMKAQVKNRFGRTSEMTDLTADYIHLQMSERSEWAMKVLVVNDSTKVICVISTACAPACDSNIRFYTTNWKELPVSDFIELPKLDDFFEVPDSSDMMEAYTRAHSAVEDMMLLKMNLSKTAELSIALATLDYAGKEEAKKIAPYVHSPLIYIWQKDKKRYIKK